MPWRSSISLRSDPFIISFLYTYPGWPDVAWAVLVGVPGPWNWVAPNYALMAVWVPFGLNAIGEFIANGDGFSGIVF
jgi:hypothetical protein